MARRALLTVLLAIVVYTAMVLLSDVQRVRETAIDFDPAFIPLILMLPLANYFLRFLKWHYLLKRLGVSIPPGKSMIAFLAGFSMTVSPGKFGELLKCYLLRDSDGLPVSKTSSVVVAERITDLISMLMIALAGILLTGGSGSLAVVGAGAAFVVVVLVCILSRRAFALLAGLACRLPFFSRKEEALERFRRSSRSVLDVRGMMVTVPLGIASWGVEALVLSVVAAALGYSLPAGSALLAHSAATIAGAVSMIPGGLGLTEGAIDVLIRPALESTAAATVVTIVMRFATLWFAVGLGLAALGSWRSVYGAIDRRE